jgi:hypothetical protein
MTNGSQASAYIIQRRTGTQMFLFMSKQREDLEQIVGMTQDKTRNREEDKD